ncbi:histidine kinase [Haloglomus irregulare]|uniref:histidine kinase n=1 Tax=Haloglomus irregulare TaxID=2234134 RepID=A0A554MUD9_9EURY|nr:PAS domain-containing sensor histidine kinase [Haloglomus irregulare]TSD08752.1 histidine kinase [Haloglomus irregulare]
MAYPERAPAEGVVLPEVYEYLRVGVILHHPETGAILDNNHRLESMFGYSTDELREMNIEDFTANTYHFSQAEAERRIRAAGDGPTQQFEWRVKCSNGQLIWVEVYLASISIDDQSYVLGEIRDITEYKTNDRRLGLFYRLLRHNIRNDVNVISGYADRISPDREASDLITDAETIRETANGLTGVVDSVKQIEETITRKDSERTLRRVATVVETVADEHREAYPHASIDVTERTVLWVETDEELRDALEQAIENAIVHNDQPEPTVSIRIDESPNTGRVEIKISDTGPPIPQMELTALDEYSERTSTTHGSGVGLFVMKWCVEALGGEFRFAENRPRGNSVYIYLPPKADPSS